MTSLRKRYSNWPKALGAGFSEKLTNPNLRYGVSFGANYGFGGGGIQRAVRRPRSEFDTSHDRGDSSRANYQESVKRQRVDAQSDLFATGEFDNSFTIDGDLAAPSGMETDQDIQNVSGGGRSGASAPVTSNLISIPRNLTPKPQTIRLTKNWIFYCYGIANKEIISAPKTTQNVAFKSVYNTTSLNYIPVDYLPFYVSKSEYETLPKNCCVKSVSCDVTVLGSRTTFDTASTSSGQANSEYVPVGMCAIGLNINHELQNRKYELNQMVATAIKALDLKEASSKWYDGHSSGVMGIPRHNNMYAVMLRGRQATYPNGATDNGNYFEVGGNNLVQNCDRFLVNSAVGATILQYSYEPQNAVITETFPLKLAFDVNIPGSFDYPATSISINSGSSGLTTEVPKNFLKLSSDNKSNAKWERNIESHVSSTLRGGMNDLTAQPQLHIGLLAIPQINPSTELTTYQNSAMYFSCATEIEIVVAYPPSVTALKHIPYNKDVILCDAKKRILSNGHCVGRMDVSDYVVGNSTEGEFLPPQHNIRNRTSASGIRSHLEYLMAQKRQRM